MVWKHWHTGHLLVVQKYECKLLSSLGEFKSKIKRSSLPKVFCKKGVPENFAKFTEKSLHQSLFLNKISGAALLKKRLRHKCFTVHFTKFLRTPSFIENFRWLLLNKVVEICPCKLCKQHQTYLRYILAPSTALLPSFYFQVMRRQQK